MRELFSFITGMYMLFAFSAGGAEGGCGPKDRECYSKAGYPACRSRIDLDKYYEFLNTDKDSISQEIVSDKDRCIRLKAGQKAVIQYYDTDKVKIYFRELEKSYWVSKEALYGGSR